MLQHMNIPEKLTTEIAGKRIKSPIGWGSTTIHCPWGMNVDKHARYLLKHIEAGAGYVTLGTAVLERDQLEKACRFVYYEIPGIHAGKEYGAVYFTGYASQGTGLHPIDNMRLVIKKLREEVKEDNVAIIGSIMGNGADLESWKQLAQIEEDSGVDLLEVNAACPAHLGEEKIAELYAKRVNVQLGGVLGDRPELLEEIIRCVSSSVKIPVGVKLTATGYPRILMLANTAVRAGAKFLVTPPIPNPSIIPFDIYNEGTTPLPYVEGAPTICNPHGPANISTTLHYVARISQFVPEIDIIGTGGVWTPEDVVQLLLLGAKCAEVCTAAIFKGRGIFRRTINFLDLYMDQMGYPTLDDLRGIALKYIKENSKCDFKVGKVVAKTDITKCNGCKQCTDILCEAYYVKNGKVLVDPELCGGCGLCVAVCPTKARKLILRMTQFSEVK